MKVEDNQFEGEGIIGKVHIDGILIVGQKNVEIVTIERQQFIAHFERFLIVSEVAVHLPMVIYKLDIGVKLALLKLYTKLLSLVADHRQVRRLHKGMNQLSQRLVLRVRNKGEKGFMGIEEREGSPATIEGLEDDGKVLGGVFVLKGP